MIHMSETVADLGQRYIAALWGAAASIGADEIAMQRLSGLVESISEAEAQLAGLRLHLLREAKLSAADSVIDGVRRPNRSLADFVAPKGLKPDYIGLFAVTAGLGVEKKEKQI